MDLQNMDEFLDLQDQNTTNLLSTEQIQQPEQIEEEWHSATPLNEMLTSNDKDWSLLQTQLDNLQSINLTDIIPTENCITPNFLIKQDPVKPETEQRVTRSRSAGKPATTAAPANTVKKTKTRAKKLYCICKQPYNGKPMVQCDQCQEWYHCACVSFDPDTEDEEDIDWICPVCTEGTKKQTEQEETKVPATRQTRGRHQSTCLYEGCNNHTKADSFCSDVCARKHNSPRRVEDKDYQQNEESENEESEKEKSEKEESEKEKSEKEESEKEQSEHEQDKKETPMSPSQMTEQENPVRRNVIKNMTNILKSIFESALEKNGDMFEASEQSSLERAEELAKSIENTMLKELGDKRQSQRTCGDAYKNKFRSLLYNLKDKANDVFQLRVVTGDLSPMDLAKMSSEDMANPELKSMSEVLRKKSLKNSVLKVENIPIIKKTHKGDIIMISDKDDNMYSEQVQKELAKINSQHQPPSPPQPIISSLSPTHTSSSTKLDPLDDILARISLPAAPEVTNSAKRSSISSDTDIDPEAKKRKLTLDVEKLLGEEDETHFEVDEVDTTDLVPPEEEEEEQMQEPEEEIYVDQPNALPNIWEGRINMPQVAEFEAIARQVGGRILSDTEWQDVLSPTMWIEGRIPTDRVTNYVTQTQYSQSREIVLLEIEAKNARDSEKLLEYFESRKRYGVVGHNKTRVKDFYLIPLYKSQNIPDCLYVVRVEETKRQHDLFLGVLVLTKQTAQAMPQPKPVYSQPVTYQPPIANQYSLGYPYNYQNKGGHPY